MKVAFLLPSICAGGPVVNSRDIVNYISEDSSTIVYYYFNVGDKLKFDTDTKQVKFFQYLNLNDYDIVHSCGFLPDFYIALYRIFKKSNFKWVSNTQNYVEEDLRYEYRSKPVRKIILLYFWKFALKQCSNIVCLTKHMKTYYTSLLNKPDAHIHVINNGRSFYDEESVEISEEDILSINNFKKNYTLLFSSCLITKRKGLDQIIAVLPSLTNYAFMIIGDGQELENLIELAEYHKVKDRCLFLGYKQSAYRYLQFADLVLFPSRSEGFPLALIEAMAFKSAIVSSRLPLIEEIFEDEIITFEIENKTELISAIEEANKKKEILQEKAYLKYKRDFTRETIGKKYQELYMKILNKG